ncbi:hypothetical protein RFI_09436 [Reticulomyxa filosa]|uniref:Uncharacterized protein n=1 Tax=Reticulomyxa filosa TaxID=46433 RepID=X6NP40_RETFI|nr:hypothetical protein RFI_09436 [Reticulomyxa filosa]|eukprot:ETO27698.1 hypothetical protein RFI_09436 [Reticulomyxa filosa]
MVSLVAMDQGPQEESSDPALKIRGGKAFENKKYSIGMLEIPPNGIKYPEITATDEVTKNTIFIVTSSEKNKLGVKIGQTAEEKLLSIGSVFVVPNENQYSLINHSQTHSVKLTFVLMKQSNLVE